MVVVKSRVEAAGDRGLADAYYGRRAIPNIWLDAMGLKAVSEGEMSKPEVRAYYDGYDSQEDQKDWGEDA